jgi:hypothetical protein
MPTTSSDLMYMLPLCLSQLQEDSEREEDADRDADARSGSVDRAADSPRDRGADSGGHEQQQRDDDVMADAAEQAAAAADENGDAADDATANGAVDRKRSRISSRDRERRDRSGSRDKRRWVFWAANVLLESGGQAVVQLQYSCSRLTQQSSWCPLAGGGPT